MDKANGFEIDQDTRDDLTASDLIHKHLFKELLAVNEQILGLRGQVRAIRRGLICALIGGACGVLAIVAMTIALIR